MTDDPAREDPHYPDHGFERALLLQGRGHLDEAIPDYLEAIRVAPPYPEPIHNRGEPRLRTGDLTGARRDVDAGPAIDQDGAHLLSLRGQLGQDAGDLAGARASLDAATRVDPGLATAWANLGSVLYDLGDLVVASQVLAAG